MKPAIEAVDRQELERILEHARSALSDEEYQRLKAAFNTLVYVTQLVENKSTTIARMRQIVFGASSEKTAQVLKAVREAVNRMSRSRQQTIPTRHPNGRDTAALVRRRTRVQLRSKSTILL